MRRTITCLHCGQTRAHRAFGLCSICYMRDLRKRQGSVKHECANCHRMMHIWAAGICRTCYQHRKDTDYTPPDTSINLDHYSDYISQCRKGHSK